MPTVLRKTSAAGAATSLEASFTSAVSSNSSASQHPPSSPPSGVLFPPLLLTPTSQSSSPTMFSTARHTALRQARSPFRIARPTTAPQLSALARLLSTLAVLEQREGKLNVSSLAAVSAAQKLGEPVTGFVAGSNVKAVAEEAAKVEGIDKIIYVENGAYDKVSRGHRYAVGAKET